MPSATQRPAMSRRRTRGVSGAWWFARWLLVLVLSFDHVSAPFHHHHHDRADGPVEAATAAPASFDEGETHAESDEHPLLSHSAMAIRVDPSRLGQPPAVDPADAGVAVTSVAELFAALDAPPPVHWRPDRSRPDFRSHRSLPPAGRAPPLHA